jgi:phosphate transport system substrate-binding protein
LQKLTLLGVDSLSLYMMLQRKGFSIFSLALALVLTTAPKPLTSFFLANSAHAQGSTPTSFPLPSTVPSGTTVRVDGSESMVAINQALKQGFEAQYAGAAVT